MPSLPEISDQDSDSEEEGSSNKANVIYTVNSRSSLPYAWDFPAASDKKILLSINGFRRVIDVMEIGDLVPFKFNVRTDLSFLTIPHEGL